VSPSEGAKPAKRYGHSAVVRKNAIWVSIPPTSGYSYWFCAIEHEALIIWFADEGRFSEVSTMDRWRATTCGSSPSRVCCLPSLPIR
jgi:hypothetical protein